MLVQKKDNKKETFRVSKIITALKKANERLNPKATEEALWKIAGIVKTRLGDKNVVLVDEIHETVLDVLQEVNIYLYREYHSYRDYKQKFNRHFQTVLKETNRILYDGDKENANKDSTLISTKKILLADILGEILGKEFELSPEIKEAHENGDLYQHDLRDFIMGSINCCLFDTAEVLKDGFELNGVEYREPTGITSAGHIVSDIILSASSQQFGGFTVPEIDSTLAPYLEKTYYKELKHYEGITTDKDKAQEYAQKRTIRKLDQVLEAIDHRLNTINNALAQTPFVTFTFGLDTSKWGRQVSKGILRSRLAGLGKKNITAIFPKLVFLHRQEINGLPGSPNNDIKQQAIECSMNRMYPDWLSLDAGHLGEIFDKYGRAVSPMGCRAFLSPWYGEDGKPVYIGRANCGAISLNLPRYAIRANGDKKEFYNQLDHFFWLAIKNHMHKFNMMKKVKASTNPLFFCEGGCHMKLDPEDTIEEAIKTFTWSIGYIGLDEATWAMEGHSLSTDNTFAQEVLQHLNDLIDMAKLKHGLLFALYGTPAEGLCYKWAEKDKAKFGEIPHVTDKQYYTNSFHVDVREHMDCFSKQKIEADMFHLSNGGHICYNEFPRMDNFKAFNQAIDNAMRLGLYYGVNLELDMCYNCGHEGEFEGVCPKCGSTNIFSINRVCGYLGYHVIHGETRYNKGKCEEVANRVDHSI